MERIEKDGVTVEFIDVTPEQATEWLDAWNTHNRNMRYRIAGSYAVDMEADEWDLNGETIKFAEDNTLIDGQHRLQAIKDSGKTQTLLVVRGLKMSAQATIDRNTARKFADDLRMTFKEPNYLALAALVRAVFLWKRGYKYRSSGYIPSGKQLTHTYLEHPELGFIVSRAATVAKKAGLTPSVVGLCMWLFEQANPEEADTFFERLADGQNMGRGNPVWELRRQSLDWKSSGDKSKRNVVWQTAVLIKVWNWYLEGRTDIQQIGFRMGGKSPEKWPEVN
jgi:hypothetical protein